MNKFANESNWLTEKHIPLEQVQLTAGLGGFKQ